MCRAGGRRCKGSQASSRATQTARKQRSRARQALQQATAAGDHDAIAKAEQRLAQANTNVQAAKENIVHSDNSNAADHSGDVTEPTPVSVPVTGELSDKPLLENTWGDLGNNSSVHYHDDGPVGTAVRYMGPDARMDIDGEPLANVVGRIATDVVRRKTTAQQAVDDLKELRDRLPEGSRATTCVSQAVRDMDGPDTPVPQVPDGTPEVLRDLVRRLHAVPMVRREPDKELQPLLEICGRVAAGDKRALTLMGEEVKRLRNKRHESLGDSGKFEIDDAVNDAVTALKEQAQRQREQRRAGGATTPDTGSHVGTDQHERDTANRHDHGTNSAGAGRDVTSRPTPDDHTTSSSTQHTSHTWANDRGDHVSVHNTVNGNADGLIQTAVVYGNVDFTAGQVGDVTTAGHISGRAHSTTDDTHRDTATTKRNTDPGAHVGRAHDVHHETRSTVHNTGDHHVPVAGDGGDVTGDHFRETLRDAQEYLRLVTRHTTRPQRRR